jgi:hypothetical protein
MPRARPDARHDVTIVSANRETLEELRTYLRRAGFSARGARTLEECARVTASTALAFVFFPDDFRWEAVVSTLAEVAEAREDALSLLVTAHTKRFARLSAPKQTLVIPRPVWGFRIVDALRAHHEQRSSCP